MTNLVVKAGAGGFVRAISRPGGFLIRSAITCTPRSRLSRRTVAGVITSKAADPALITNLLEPS